MLHLFKFQNESIQVFGTVKNPLFIAKEVATILGYKRSRDAVKDHVWDENKMTVDDAIKVRHFTAPLNCQPHAMLLSCITGRNHAQCMGILEMQRRQYILCSERL